MRIQMAWFLRARDMKAVASHATSEHGRRASLAAERR